jgi:hypothetical protein
MPNPALQVSKAVTGQIWVIKRHLQETEARTILNIAYRTAQKGYRRPFDE